MGGLAARLAWYRPTHRGPGKFVLPRDAGQNRFQAIPAQGEEMAVPLVGFRPLTPS